jgi:HK97 family phage major capsid protein
MTTTLKQDHEALLVEVRNIAAKAESENRDFTEDERAIVQDRMTKAAEIVAKSEEQAKSRKLGDEVRTFLSASEAVDLNDGLALEQTAKGLGKSRLLSLGELYTESDEFRSALKSVATPGGQIPGGAQWRTNPVRVEATLKALLQTGVAGGNGVGNLWDPQRLATVAATERQLRMRDVITIGQTDSDSVQFARVLRLGRGSTNNAAGVPEAVTDAPIGSGTPAVTPVQAGQKPQSAIGFEKITAPVVTIAHWIAVTKKALSDASQLRTLIDNFLRDGLAREVERQVLAGDSDAGEEIDGLLNTNGLQEQAFSKNILQTIRKALTKVSVYGTANAILMSPANAERIDLLQMQTGQFYAGGPFGTGQTSVWRKPVIEVPALSDSQVLVGDFSTAVLFDREQSVVTSTDSHLDFFTRNLAAVLAECRVALAVLDPALITVAQVTGTDNMGA